MHIAVVGAGGTGGYFGGLLARAGEEVTFIARGETLTVLRARGLTVESRAEGTFTLSVCATDDPTAVGPVDLVVRQGSIVACVSATGRFTNRPYTHRDHGRSLLTDH
jgi:hypothetical protein